MRKLLSISLALTVTIGAIAGNGLDLLSRAELRRSASERKSLETKANSTDFHRQNAPQRIGAFVKLNEGYTADDLRREGIEVLTVRGDIALCMVDVDSAEQLARKDAVGRMEIARRAHTHINLGKASVGLDAVHAGSEGLDMPYTGKGVIAGVVDQGMDPNHLNFLNPDGTSRIGYFYAIDYANNINGYEHKGFWGNEVLDFTTDTPGAYHGTHTLGIMAGDYKGDVTVADESKYTSHGVRVPTTTIPNPYRGAAPDATIAAAACASLNDMFIAMGVDQICQYSYETKLPTVISMSLGSNAGPHDKNSMMNRFLDLTATKSETNPNPPIICISSGNEGDRRIALRTRIKPGETIKTMIWPSVYQYDPSVPGSVTAYQDNVAIYSEDTTKLTVKAVIYNVDRNFREAAVMPVIGDGVGAYYISDESFKMTETDIVNTTLSRYFYGSVGLGGLIDEDVNRYYAMVDYALQNNEENFNAANLESKHTNSKYVLGFEVSIADGQEVPADGIMIECYCSGQTSELYDYGQEGFANGSRNGSLSDIAIGEKMIVVGSYNTRKEWFCLDGLTSSYEGEGDYFTVGRVSGFSSYATLSDGRNLPTVCAPGSTIISSVNRYFTELSDVKDLAASYYQASAIDSKGRINYWKQEVGTSMSCPLVAGAIACWLEADPTLTYSDIQNIIAATATVDDDVRAGDPVQWGAGKFNALDGLKEVIRRGSTGVCDIAVGDDNRLVLKPLATNVYSVFLGGAPSLDVSVVSLQGTVVNHSVFNGDEATIDLSATAPGVYVVSVNNHSRKIIVK